MLGSLLKCSSRLRLSTTTTTCTITHSFNRQLLASISSTPASHLVSIHHHRAYSYFSGLGKDIPKPFLKSSAHKLRVDQTYSLSKEEVQRGRYGIPLGFSLFAILMYFCYIRDEREKDKEVVDYLTKDISDKVPPEKMERIRQELGEEMEMNEKERSEK